MINRFDIIVVVHCNPKRYNTKSLIKQIDNRNLEGCIIRFKHDDIHDSVYYSIYVGGKHLAGIENELNLYKSIKFINNKGLFYFKVNNLEIDPEDLFDWMVDNFIPDYLDDYD